MNSRLRVFSHEMPADGGVTHDAVAKLLAKEASNPWPTFFREVFQNSNDARLASDKAFQFSVEVAKLGDVAKSTVQSAQLNGGVPMKELSAGLTRLTAETPNLFVSDFGTHGLGGSLDPRLANEISRFANFFFKFGRESGQSHDGGAFGFGRNVFFSASEAATIFVHTRFRDSGRIHSRLMGMTANRHFVHDGKNFTGRHWWCYGRSPDGTYLPFQDEESDLVARDLGFPEFPDNETGTIVMVLSPKTVEPEKLASTIQLSSLVHAWPHYLDEPGRKRAEFSFSSFGSSLPNISPLDRESPLQLFAATFQDAVNHSQNARELTCSSVPASLKDRFTGKRELTRSLGSVVSETFPRPQLNSVDSDFFDAGLPTGSCIALMRSPRIIVKYLPLAESSAVSKTIGCFVANSEWDPVYRESENITHDEWEPGRLNLPKGSPNPVLQTLNKIPELFISESRKISSSGSGNATLADEIGSLLTSPAFGGQGNDGELPGGTGGTGGGGGGKPRIIPLSTRLLSVEGNLASGLFEFKVDSKSQVILEEIELTPYTLTAIGKEGSKDGPLGATPPKISKKELRQGESHIKILSVEIEFEAGTQVGLSPSFKGKG